MLNSGLLQTPFKGNMYSVYMIFCTLLSGRECLLIHCNGLSCNLVLAIGQVFQIFILYFWPKGNEKDEKVG